MQIRIYEQGDHEAVAALMDDFGDELAAIDPRERLIRAAGMGQRAVDRMLTRAEMHGGKIVVAMSDEQIVGLASGEVYKRDPDEELEVIDYVNGEVSELYVVPSHRRNGIGPGRLRPPSSGGGSSRTMRRSCSAPRSSLRRIRSRSSACDRKRRAHDREPGSARYCEEVVILLEPESMGARRTTFDHALEADRVECQWVHLHRRGEPSPHRGYVKVRIAPGSITPLSAGPGLD